MDVFSLSQDPQMTSRVPAGQNCLIGCCNANLEEPSSFQSQVAFALTTITPSECPLRAHLRRLQIGGSRAMAHGDQYRLEYLSLLPIFGRLCPRQRRNFLEQSSCAHSALSGFEKATKLSFM